MHKMNIKFSCLVDNNPKFIYQSILWINSLIESGSAEYEDLVIHVIKGVDEEYISELSKMGIEVVPVEP